MLSSKVELINWWAKIYVMLKVMQLFWVFSLPFGFFFLYCSNSFLVFQFCQWIQTNKQWNDQINLKHISQKEILKSSSLEKLGYEALKEAAEWWNYGKDTK